MNMLHLLLTGWVFEPSVILGVAVAGLLYARGIRYSAERGMARHYRWWQSLAFAGGLLTLLIALVSPIDAWSDRLFWVHMLQHELLILVAAPLLLLGAPLMPLWRSVPLGARRASLSWALRQGWPIRVGDAVAHTLGRPLVAWVLFVLVFTVWHLPALYDLALEQPPIHVLEHLLFLGVALLFWAQIIPSWPLRRRLTHLRQAFYLGAAAVEMNVIAATFMYSTAPIYPYYAALSRGAGAGSVLIDQHIAGAVMDAPGTILLFGAICGLLVLWLRDDERASQAQDKVQVYAGGGRWGSGAGPSAPEVR